MYVFGHVCECVHGICVNSVSKPFECTQRRTLGILLCHYLPIFWRQDVPLNLDLGCQPASHWHPLSLSLRAVGLGNHAWFMYVGSGNLNLAHQSLLTNEPSPQTSSHFITNDPCQELLLLSMLRLSLE